jgi:hypothetical protein
MLASQIVTAAPGIVVNSALSFNIPPAKAVKVCDKDSLFQKSLVCTSALL